MKDQIISTLAAINRPGMPALLDFLRESDFFEAPASTEYHLAVKGGLATHSWNVYEALKSSLYTPPGIAPESLAIVGLMHDLCKANFYKVGSRNVKNEATGQWEKKAVYLVDDQDPLGHGEKSVIITQRYIPLTEDEALAIRWHMGRWDAESYTQQKALNKAIEVCPLVRAVILADQTAAYFMEPNTKESK